MCVVFADLVVWWLGAIGVDCCFCFLGCRKRRLFVVCDCGCFVVIWVFSILWVDLLCGFMDLHYLWFCGALFYFGGFGYLFGLWFGGLFVVLERFVGVV